MDVVATALKLYFNLINYNYSSIHIIVMYRGEGNSLVANHEVTFHRIQYNCVLTKNIDSAAFILLKILYKHLKTIFFCGKYLTFHNQNLLNRPDDREGEHVNERFGLAVKY